MCDQVRLKLACSVSKAIYILEILDLPSIGIILSKQQKNKDPDQTAQMHRLICIFVVCIWHKAGFLMMWLIFIGAISKIPRLLLDSAAIRASLSLSRQVFS